MTVGAIINVKDDVELLEKNLHYHQKIGVDYFLLCDRGSTKASLARIDEIAQHEAVSVFKHDIYTLPTDSDAFKNRRIAGFYKMVETFAPDWIMFVDVDEFWVPRSGHLQATETLKTSDVLTVPRFNAALTPEAVPALLEKIEDAHTLDEQEIIVKPISLSRNKMEENPHLPWIVHKVDPKVMTKLRDVTRIDPGFHDLQSTASIYRAIPDDLLILHIPFTTKARFRKKVDNMRIHLEHIGHTLDGDLAWHWKRWIDEVQDPQTLNEEFNKQFFGPSLLQVFRKRNAVMRIKDYFETVHDDKNVEKSDP